MSHWKRVIARHARERFMPSLDRAPTTPNDDPAGSGPLVKRSDITDREALEACWGHGKPAGSGGLTVLMQAGYPQKVAERKLEQLISKGWLDYGVSIGFPWRTPEGEAELERLGVE